MLRFSSDCPFCKERKTGFIVVACGEVGNFGSEFVGAARCNNRVCGKFVSFLMGINYLESTDKLLKEHRRSIDAEGPVWSDVSIDKYIKTLRIFPEPEKADIPEFLPEEIQRLFSDAEAVRLIGEQGAGAAVGQYRSVLDKTLPALALGADVPTVGKNGKELSRFPLIDRLSEADILPQSIRGWIGSDGIRKILTAASHGEKITSEQAQEISEITRFILIYVFTLPERVKRAQDDFAKKI